MITLYKSLVRSLLEYCCPLWDPTKFTEIQMLEGVQRTFTSRIGGLNDMNYWERLAHLNLMSLQRRRERYTILMMWKILHKVVPNLCKIKFIETLGHGAKAVIPSLSKCSSPRNQTLSTVHSQCEDQNFGTKCLLQSKQRKRLIFLKFLALIPDNPPVSGYTCSWSNSLVDFTSTRWSDI